MRQVSAKWAPAIASSHRVLATVYALRTGSVDRIVPILAGQITYDASAVGQRRVTLTVPLIDDNGFDWDPAGDPLHPLAAYGQELMIFAGVVYSDNVSREEVSQGSYLITGTDVDEQAGTVTVQAADLMERWIACRVLNNPYDGFGPGWMFKEVLERLAYPDLVVNPGYRKITAIDSSAMTDRALRGNIEIVQAGGQDRVPILQKLCEAWPAQMAIDDLGTLVFRPPVLKPATTPVARITAGAADSTLITRGVRQQRARAYNGVYVSGMDPKTGTRRAYGFAERSTGALAVSGPYGYVPRWFSSTLIYTDAQAKATAESMLARGLLYTRTEEVTCVPNPALELYDTVQVTSPRGGTFKGLVVAIVLPLTSAGGPMQLTVTTDATEE
ncbi:hypothetical protein [Streptomyces sp. NPDC051546]|uniref:hypothetical protein n=1 Tax=Streptomyces sp. NPDC051546 TaxID=3365655 RepID=UPI0037A9E3B5